MLVGCVGRQGWSEEVKKSGILMYVFKELLVTWLWW